MTFWYGLAGVAVAIVLVFVGLSINGKDETPTAATSGHEDHH